MMDNDFLIDKKIKEKLMSENNLVPLSVHQIIIDTGNTLVKKRVRKSISKFKYIVASLLLCVVGFTTLGVTNPAYAQKIPVIGSVYKALNHMFYSNYNEYSSDLDLSSTSNGYKITISQVAYDGVKLAIAYTITSKSPLPVYPKHILLNYEINGYVYCATSVPNYSEELSKDKKTFRGVIETTLAQNSFITPEAQGKTAVDYIEIPPDKFDLKINIYSFEDIRMEKEKRDITKVAGKWSFNTVVSNEKSKGKVNEIKTNINLYKVGKGLEINKLIYTPLNTILVGTIHKFDNSYGIDFIVYDNYGRRLVGKGSNMGDMGTTVCFSFAYNGIYKDTKTLTFLPCVASTTKLTKRVKPKLLSSELNLGGETSIPLGKQGELQITKVEASNGKTNIYYKITSGLSARLMAIVDKASKKKIQIVHPERYLKASNQYVVTVDTTLKNSKYLMQYYYLNHIKIFENQKFTITVKK